MRAVKTVLMFLVLSVSGVVVWAQDNSVAVPLQRIEVMDLRDMDIKDALKFIAQRSGLDIVAGDNIQGRVTAYAEDVEPRAALATVLESSRLAYEEKSGLIRVITDEDYQARYGRPFSQKLSSKLITLKGIKPSVAAALLEKIKNQFGHVVPDDPSRTVLLEDSAEKIAEMETYLQAIDKPVIERVFTLKFVDVEALAARLQEMATSQLGNVRADKSSNKIFISDTAAKIDEMERYIREVDMPRQPVVFELSYAKAEELAALLKTFLSKEGGAIEIDQRSNKLIVVDVPSKIEEIRTMVAQLDRKEAEVLIEARIIQVVLKDEFKMGVDWEAVLKSAHGMALSSVWGGVGAGGKGSLAVGTLSDDNYRAVVEVLGAANKTHILSNPRIAVINHEEAKILVGTTKPYVTTTTTTPSSGPVSVSEEVKFIDVGVKLVVTPSIHADGYITMKIRPEVSSAATSIKTGQNNIIPIVETSQVETTVRVKDGVTIMIGGLIKDEKVRDDSKIPLLGDIPIVGAPFRSTSRGKEKTEIVIFLTPRVISGDLVGLKD